MSLEWARARARENAARLTAAAEADGRVTLVQQRIGPLLCWRPNRGQPDRRAADCLLCQALHGAHLQGVEPANGLAPARAQPQLKGIPERATADAGPEGFGCQ
jgi:hypothetical protein